jgi:predicted transglutaminase-like cysteine proteinase
VLKSYKVLAEAHEKLFKKFKWQSDQQTFGKVERWGFPLEVDGISIGDCDDFAYQIYTEMKGEGYQPRLVLCTTETKETHLVCELDGWVADNRYPEIHTARWLQDFGYEFIGFNNPNSPNDWIRFTGFK